MIILNQKSGDIRVQKITPSNVNIRAIELILSEYVGEALATNLAQMYISLIAGRNDMLIIEKNSEVNELEDCFGVHLKTCDEFKKFKDALRSAGLKEEKAYQCAISTFMAPEDFETVHNNLMRKKKEELEVAQRIASEPPTWIPNGYKHIGGNMLTGIVIADKYGNEFTYIPYMDIYVSRYEISEGEYGWGRSVAGEKAWVNIKYKRALKVAKEFDPNSNSDLLTSISRIKESVFRKTGIEFPGVVYNGKVELRTGAMPENMIYNIDCLVGNHYCILKSKNPRQHVRVGGTAYIKKHDDYFIYEDEHEFTNVPNNATGFRICLSRD